MIKGKLIKEVNTSLNFFKQNVFERLLKREIPNGTTESEITYFVQIDELPEKGLNAQKSKKISVFIKSYYKFCDNIVSSYGTKMVYVRKHGSEPLKFGMHFDGSYQAPVQSFHPFCHVQYDNGILEAEFEHFNLTDILQIQCRDSLKNIRIPTANMDLISTLTMVAADHVFMGTAKNQEFERMLRIALPFGQHKISSLYNGGPQANSIGASCWYCH